MRHPRLVHFAIATLLAILPLASAHAEIPLAGFARHQLRSALNEVGSEHEWQRYRNDQHSGATRR